MRWTRNPVYPLLGIGGLNPSSSAKFRNQEPSFYSFIKTTRHEKIIIPIFMLLPLMTAQAQTVLTEEQQLEQAQKQLEAAKKALEVAKIKAQAAKLKAQADSINAASAKAEAEAKRLKQRRPMLLSQNRLL